MAKKGTLKALARQLISKIYQSHQGFCKFFSALLKSNGHPSPPSLPVISPSGNFSVAWLNYLLNCAVKGTILIFPIAGIPVYLGINSTAMLVGKNSVLLAFETLDGCPPARLCPNFEYLLKEPKQLKIQLGASLYKSTSHQISCSPIQGVSLGFYQAQYFPCGKYMAFIINIKTKHYV